MSKATQAWDSVLAERIRQDSKWGEQNHGFAPWMCILMEEVGECAEAVNETIFNNGPEARKRGGLDNIRKEAVQVAAVAIAMVECIDRIEEQEAETGKGAK